ncbi:Dual specificity tyrosine-phosphorylation-regulated kinase, partial [Entophlyctis luteolus]
RVTASSRSFGIATSDSKLPVSISPLRLHLRTPASRPSLALPTHSETDGCGSLEKSVIDPTERKLLKKATSPNTVDPMKLSEKVVGPSMRQRAKSFGGPAKVTNDNRTRNSTSSKSVVKSTKTISGDIHSAVIVPISGGNRTTVSAKSKKAVPAKVTEKNSSTNPIAANTPSVLSSSSFKKSTSAATLSSASGSSFIRGKSKDTTKPQINSAGLIKPTSSVKFECAVPAAAEPQTSRAEYSQEIRGSGQILAHFSATSPSVPPGVPLPVSTMTALQATQSNQQQIIDRLQENLEAKPYPPASSLKLPLSPDVTLHYFGALLTPYEQEEVLNYPEVWFAGSSGVQKIGSSNRPTGVDGVGVNIPGRKPENDDDDDGSASGKDGGYHNFARIGYDDARGDFYLTHHDHIAYRYEMISLLGKGSFGQCVKCYDHKMNRHVAVKIIRNKKRFERQGLVEVKEPSKHNYVVQMYESFTFRGHLCISFEILGINLYEWTKAGGYRGIHTGLIKKFAFQILKFLELLSAEDIVHCDLKPENILFVDPTYKQPNVCDFICAPDSGLSRSSSLPSDFKPSNPQYDLKVIDLGSSCFSNEMVYTYVQSRFYRSPEVILGISYTAAIDMWSFGCILAELFIGYPLFPGENESQQLALMMEVLGVPPVEMLMRGSRSKLFFDMSSGLPKPVNDSKGRRRKPNSKSLAGVLCTNDTDFVAFLEKCFEWDPERRFTPVDALSHKWMVEYCDSTRMTKKGGSTKTGTSLEGLLAKTSGIRHANRKSTAFPTVDTALASAKSSVKSAVDTGTVPVARKKAAHLRVSLSGPVGFGSASAGAGSSSSNAAQVNSAILPSIGGPSAIAARSTGGIASRALPKQAVGANFSRSSTSGNGSKGVTLNLGPHWR